MLIACLLLPSFLSYIPPACRRPQRIVYFRQRLGASWSSIPGRVQDMDAWVRFSSDSLQKFTGKSLYEEMEGSNARTPSDVHTDERYAVLSHGNQADPIYNYFNKGAFLAFEFPEETVYQMQSRYSAPDGKVRSERDGLIQTIVEQDGLKILTNAIRRKGNGELFLIPNVILWNVYDDEGNRVGQTAIFDSLSCQTASPEMVQ